ncbi:hypothetical protein [Arthrobacter sp. STN4]|uniref:hypothetical protein n=1 Tax=Arthrobacter sp. STN4 TaxID=2923276 RepID=UPI00211A7B15|nr:hypothetical protein [Arthrobacter sp. STN4]MCQ9164893.1 hypothetical protein [Arthrobacter sp. STN4]
MSGTEGGEALMAYPMSRALPGSGRIPLPASPIVWDGYVRKTRRALLLVGLLWALAVAMLGFFSPFHLAHTLDSPDRFIPALLFVVGVVGALALGPEIGANFKHVMGYGFLKQTSAAHSRTIAPHRARRVTYGAVLCGLLLGCVAAAALRLTAGDALEALLLASIAVLLAIPTRKALRHARILWRQARDERGLQAILIDDGEHSVGRVASVTWEKRWVDGMALFHVELEHQAGGREETTKVRLLAYPIWAPAEGNEYDVWTDPERPFDKARTLIERRYVGQEFADFSSEPAPPDHVPSAIETAADTAVAVGSGLGHRGHAAGTAASAVSGRAHGTAGLHGAEPRGDTGRAAGRVSPPWLPRGTRGARAVPAVRARRTRRLLALPPLVISVLAVAGALLVPPMVADVPWWTVTALWLYAVLTAVNAWVYWQFMIRSRWVIRSGISFGATESAVFVGFFAAGFCVLSTPSLVDGPVHGGAPWTLAHYLVGAALLGALLVFEWAFSSTASALNHLNAEFPAPAEKVQEALTGCDPAGIDRLEADYGYRAGVLLCG